MIHGTIFADFSGGPGSDQDLQALADEVRTHGLHRLHPLLRSLVERVQAPLVQLVDELKAERDRLTTELDRLVAELEDAGGDVVSPDGGEAEELRSGIERLIAERTHDGVPASQLQELLDRVDARDSLATLIERDQLSARVAELEEHAKQVSFAAGLFELKDPEVGPFVQAAPEEVLESVKQLFARVVELEAPPVVPEGWTLEKRNDIGGFYTWGATDASMDNCIYQTCMHPGEVRSRGRIPVAVLIAFARAIAADKP